MKAWKDASTVAEKTVAPALKPRREQPRATGYAALNASPWAEVTVDGVARGSTPIPDLELSVGRHKATFTNPELGVTKQQSFVVKSGETTPVIVELRP